MVRAYGALEFLNLSQVINYLKLLCDLEIEPRILIQLINDKKIPCYVDVNGIHGFSENSDEAFSCESVVGVGRSLLDSATISLEQYGYKVEGILKGVVTIEGKSLEHTVRRWDPMMWGYSESNKLQFMLCGGNIIFQDDNFHMRPADVKKFVISLNSDSSKTIIREDANESALLMIAYLRDLVCDPADGRDNAAKRVPTQNKLALELYEKYGLSTSSSEKLFADAKNAAKEKVKSKKQPS